MSLESKIDALTAAIEKLAASLGTTVTVSVPAEEVKQAAKAAAKPAKTSAAAKEVQKAEKAALAGLDDALEGHTPETAVDARKVGEALVALMKRDGSPAGGLKLLSKYGAKRAGDLNPGDRAAFYKDVQAALNG